MSRVLITGPARSGTTLLLLLARYFADCHVYADHERHPMANNPLGQAKHTIIKHPYGYGKHFPPPYSAKGLLEQDWKIICLIRDPRDTLVSHNMREDNTPGKGDGSYWCLPESWIASTKVSEQYDYMFGDTPHQSFMTIWYEELVMYTQSALEQISKWLGVGLQAGWEKFYDNDVARRWGTLNGARPIDSESIGAWKNPKHTAYLKKVITPEIIRIGGEFLYHDLWDE